MKEVLQRVLKRADQHAPGVSQRLESCPQAPNLWRDLASGVRVSHVPSSNVLV